LAGLIPTEESEALPTVIPAGTLNRSDAAKPLGLTGEARSAPAVMEATARDIPEEDAIPVILRGRTRVDPILPVRVHPVGDLRTFRAAREARPAQAPATGAAPARPVQAALAAARAAGPSEGLASRLRSPGRSGEYR